MIVAETDGAEGGAECVSLSRARRQWLRAGDIDRRAKDAATSRERMRAAGERRVTRVGAEEVLDARLAR